MSRVEASREGFDEERTEELIRKLVGMSVEGAEGLEDVDQVLDMVIGEIQSVAGSNVGETVLKGAAELGDVGSVNRLVALGVDVDHGNGTDAYGTALHRAAAEGHVDCVEALLAHGAAVDAVTKSGATPLFAAAECDSRDVVEVLIASGADVDLANMDGRTPLSMAAARSAVPDDGDDLSHVVGLLLVAGARVDVGGPDGWLPIHHAAMHSKVHVIHALVAFGADVDARTLTANDHWPCGGMTPLHVATQQDHWDAVDCAAALVAAGASLDLRDHSYSTPLQDAASLGNDRIVRVLCAAEKRRFVAAAIAAALGGRIPAALFPTVLDFVLSLEGHIGECEDAFDTETDSDESESDDGDDGDDSDDDDDDDDNTDSSDSDESETSEAFRARLRDASERGARAAAHARAAAARS